MEPARPLVNQTIEKKALDSNSYITRVTNKPGNSKGVQSGEGSSHLRNQTQVQNKSILH